ncbi:hypothetical protein CH063_08160 [Colletotrichum higginsianum]|uniref:Uncharacterized protein n=1 Tax=Colletotrichum higginsianum (strain IMI 349063) TaxID=759273 RepID=H1V8T3_COLHI|nr:hypothetical protein CH063_08160 [Colletotrichum higginsianum]
MGIRQFWNVVNEVGKERSLAQWAADHLKEQGRPLRIAVDEAHWRFKNVTDAKEAEIQKSSVTQPFPLFCPRGSCLIFRLNHSSTVIETE